MKDLRKFIKTTIREFLNENSEFKEKYRQEYINYHGDDTNFNKLWSSLTSNDFNKGGLINIPEYVELSRLIHNVGEIKMDNNIHWVRTKDEYLFYDRDWLFLSGIKIDKDTKIIRIKTRKSNIDIEKTLIQNLTFDYEREITLKNLYLTDYQIVNY